MNQNKLSSRARTVLKSAVAAAMVPVLFIYIMIAKPDYRIMNSMAHVVVPVARWTGGVITWPVRLVGNTIANVREMGRLRAENEELRDALDAMRRRANECDVAISENQRLARELDMVTAGPHDAVIADVRHNPGAFNHDTIFINRGTADGIAPGMAVVSMDNSLVGIVMDAGRNYSRVRTLVDSDISIAVRIAGAEVYGFLTGNGTRRPGIGFFSDPQFQPTPDIKLVTSSISGVLPGAIFVGTMTRDMDVEITDPGTVGRVMVLRFDNGNEYK